MFFSFGACLARAECGMHLFGMYLSRLGDVLAAITEPFFLKVDRVQWLFILFVWREVKSQDVTGIQYPLWPPKDPLSRT